MFIIPPALDRSITGAVDGFALLKGGKPERILAGFVGAIWFWNSFLHRYWLGSGSMYQLALDVAVLLSVVVLALPYDRWWLLVAGMTSVLCIATDVSAFAMPLHWWTYGTALFTWGYVFLAALATGTWRAWRARGA